MLPTGVDSRVTAASVATASTTFPTINHRVLLSLREGAKVIGTKGATIQRIRENNDVKIGLSEKQAGCSDRVLSCAGRIPNVANALGEIVEVLNDYDASHDTEGNSIGAVKYPYHFLNPILPPPSKDEIKDSEQLKNIGSLRLLTTNSQLSSIIGKGGCRIKSLIDKHGVKIVASRDFLPDSDERILEMQGFPGSITITLMEISEILLNEIDINFGSETRYYPHLRSHSSANSHPNTYPQPHVYQNQGGNTNLRATNRQYNSSASHNIPRNVSTNIAITPNKSNWSSGTDNEKRYSNEFKVILRVPEIYVGAIVGRQGNRIANLRKFSKTKIIVDKKDESADPTNSHRNFTITGDLLKNVKLAESMLLKNLDAEIERRQERVKSKLSKGN